MNHCIYRSLVVVIKTRKRNLVRGESKRNGVVMEQHGKGKQVRDMQDTKKCNISRVKSAAAGRIGCRSRNNIIEFAISDPNLYHFYLTVIGHRRCI